MVFFFEKYWNEKYGSVPNLLRVVSFKKKIRISVYQVLPFKYGCVANGRILLG